MKKRMTFLLLGAVLLAMALFLGVLLLAVAVRDPEQLDSVLKSGLLCLVLLLPVAIFGAVRLAGAETKRLANALNRMDISQPEKILLDRELSPLVGKLQKQNDVIAAQLKQIREESANVTFVFSIYFFFFISYHVKRTAIKLAPMVAIGTYR